MITQNFQFSSLYRKNNLQCTMGNIQFDTVYSSQRSYLRENGVHILYNYTNIVVFKYYNNISMPISIWDHIFCFMKSNKLNLL